METLNFSQHRPSAKLGPFVRCNKFSNKNSKLKFLKLREYSEFDLNTYLQLEQNQNFIKEKASQA